MKHLAIQLVRRPDPDAERNAAEALDALAEGIADLFIARARKEIADQRGVSEEVIDREHERVAADARGLSPLGMFAEGIR